jgi:hypothetical protein
VDGEDHLWPPQAIMVIAVPKGLRHTRSAPIVAVQNVRLAPSLQQELQGGLRMSCPPTVM